MVDPTPRPPRAEPPPSVVDIVELVTAYAKQETIGPLRGAGRWLAFGAAGAVTLGIGLSLVLLGALRLVQAEWDRSSSGSLSWLAYVVVFLLTVALLVLVLSRINKTFLNKEPS